MATKNSGCDTKDLEECIAWLEKLKVFTEHGDGLYYFGNNGFTYVGSPIWDNDSWLEKQESKSNPYNGVSISHDNGVDILFDKKPIKHISGEKKGEQKYALDIEIPFGAKDSELQEATYLIPEGFHAKIEGDKVVIKKGKQKPAIWSEEDERMCQETIDWFEKKCFPYALEHENPARESISWLKSLKQRHTWKPSDEQMKLLKELVEDNNQRYFYTLLKSLYEQLKKLKGE